MVNRRQPSEDQYLTQGILDTRDRSTPLHFAANNGHFSVCELIINNISRKNPGDECGWTPLHSAAQNGHLRVCKLILRNILESKAYSCNPYDEYGNSPFKLATEFCHEQVKTAILDAERKRTDLEEKKKADEEPWEKYRGVNEENEEVYDPFFNWELLSQLKSRKKINQKHSMAIGNLNKSKETMPTTTTALKVAPQRTIYHKN